MSIVEYKGQTLTVGQWITGDSYLRSGFASGVALIAKVTAKSIVAAEHRSYRGGIDVGPPRMMCNTSVTFVCDTMEEAQAVIDAHRKHVESEMRIERRLSEEASERRRAAIAALVSGGAA